MSNKELGNLACKILGVFLIIQGTNLLASFLQSWITAPEIMAVGLAGLAYPLGYILFGLLLWLFAGKLSAIMVSRKEEDNRERAVSGDDLQRIAFSVLGVYFVSDALPRLVSSVFSVQVLLMGKPYPIAMILLTAAGPITELIIGIALFFGSRALVNFLK